MYKLSYLFLILSSLSICLSKVSHNNVAKYHALVNEAENLIVCNKFEAAEAKYNLAWLELKEPFPNDILNRMVCNHQLKNVNVIFDNAKLLVKLTGVSLKKIKEKYRYLLFYHDEWKKFENWHPNGIIEFQKGIANDIKNKSFEIQELDQRYRKSEDRYTKFKKDNESADSITLRKLIELISYHGYPNTNKIGVLEVNDILMGFQDVLRISILHSFQNADESWSFENGVNLVDQLDSLLHIAIFEGKMHPEQYNLFMYGREVHTSGMGVKSIYEPPITIIEGNYYIKPMKFNLLDSVNIVRKRLYLDNLEEFYAKALFMAKNEEMGFDLLSQGCCVTYHLKNPEQELYTAKQFGVIPLSDEKNYEFYNICK